MPSSEAVIRSKPEPSGDPEPPPRLVIDVVHEAGDWAALGTMEEMVAPVIAAITRHHLLQRHLPAEACVAMANDAAMQRLNAQFRGKDKPTNVLSFPSGVPNSVALGALPNGCIPRVLGDVILGLETVLREASEHDIAPANHVRHLVLHGLLHLMGYDHETDVQAEVMEALESEILTGLGIADPYAEAAIEPAKS